MCQSKSEEKWGGKVGEMTKYYGQIVSGLGKCLMRLRRWETISRSGQNAKCPGPAHSISQSVSQSVSQSRDLPNGNTWPSWDFGHRAGCRPNWNANADTKLLLKYFPNCLDSCDCYGYSISKQKRKEIVMISSASQLLRLYAFHSLHLAGCMNKTFKPS